MLAAIAWNARILAVAVHYIDATRRRRNACHGHVLFWIAAA
jgi:hypothetical protein